jgi:hypothetical protein
MRAPTRRRHGMRAADLEFILGIGMILRRCGGGIDKAATERCCLRTAQLE